MSRDEALWRSAQSLLFELARASAEERDQQEIAFSYLESASMREATGEWAIADDGVCGG